jgi:hypothetical protein
MRKFLSCSDYLQDKQSKKILRTLDPVVLAGTVPVFNRSMGQVKFHIVMSVITDSDKRTGYNPLSASPSRHLARRATGTDPDRSETSMEPPDPLIG